MSSSPHGRGRPSGRSRRLGDRRHRPFPPHASAGPPDGDAASELLADVRAAASAGHPIALLAVVSSLLALAEAPRGLRGRTPGAGVAPPPFSREDLVHAFLEIERPETSLVLGVIAGLSPDELERARIWRELRRREATLPAWVAALPRARAVRALVMGHVLHDGESLFVDVELAHGELLCAVLYVDHHLGSAAKDAFVANEAASSLLARFRASDDDPDVVVDDLSLPDARARLADALANGAALESAPESDTWPGCRPLLEWACRLLPPGGTGYRRPVWDQRARDALARRFLRSRFATGLPEEICRGPLDLLVRFGCEEGSGDPLDWSPSRLEILVASWLGRQAPVAPLELLVVLRRFVAFCHDQRGLRPSLTRETLAATDHWTRPASPKARAARPVRSTRGRVAPEGRPAASGNPTGPRAEVLVSAARAQLLDDLARAVGGVEALESLDDEPLPPEEFCWDGVPDDVRAPVATVLATVDRCCEALFDLEARTVARRLLARAARGEPGLFLRMSRPELTAAALCWLVGKANDLVGGREDQVSVATLCAHAGLAHTTVASRAAALSAAGGLAADSGPYGLGTPELLTSRRRRALAELRDRLRGAGT